ncbi:cytokine receptor common subunit gamma-like [Anableps anableps]
MTDVTCLVINLEHVRCVWNLQGIPEVNYTFSSWFSNEKESTCTEYLSENGINIGCRRPCTKLQRFDRFYTKLSRGNKEYLKEHDLKGKVKLNPPSNLTVKNGSDFNLWFYWNQTGASCVESEVRVKKNNSNWEVHSLFLFVSHCQNLPSSNARYELQVRSRISNNCGQSEEWSDWSEPVVWGFNNTTGLQTTCRNNKASDKNHTEMDRGGHLITPGLFQGSRWKVFMDSATE